MPDTSTSKLLAAAQRGDRRAFEDLMRAEADRLYRIACRVTGDTAAAEDVLQETFLRVLESRARCRDAGAARTWLTRIAVHTALNSVRSRQTRQRREEGYAMEARGTSSESPAERVTATELHPALSRAFAGLAMDTRAAIWLHAVEGETVREIATSLQTSRSTISRKIRSGLGQLRAALRGAGFAVGAGFSLECALRELPNAAPPPEILARIGEQAATALAAAEAATQAGSAELASEKTASATPAALNAALVAYAGAACALIAVAVVAIVVSSRSGEPVVAGGADTPAVMPLVPASPDVGSSPAPPDEPAPAEAESDFDPFGVVVDLDGQPVPHATVRAVRLVERTPWDLPRLLDDAEFDAFLPDLFRQDALVGETRSDEKGRFDLDLSPGAAYRIDALDSRGDLAGGSLRLVLEVDADESAPVTPVEIAVVPGTVLARHVVDPQGRDVDGASIVAVSLPDEAVSLVDGGGRAEESVALAALLDRLESFDMPRTTTGDDGRFWLCGFEPGRPVLLVGEKRGLGRRWAPTAPSTAEVEIALDAVQALPGRVVDGLEGEPIPGARVIAIAPSGWIDLVRADSRGEFAVQGHSDRPAKIYALRSRGMDGGVRVVLPSDEASLPFEVELEPADDHTIWGTVAALGTSEPLAGLNVRLSYCPVRSGTSKRKAWFVLARGQTDARGRYAFEGGFPYGWYLVRIEANEHAQTGWRSVRIRPDRGLAQEIRADINVGPRLAGRVVGPGGEAVVAARVELGSVVERRDEREDLATALAAEYVTTTDADGWFEFALSPVVDEAVVWARHPEYGEAVVTDVRWPRDDELIVRMMGAAVFEVRFVADDGSAVAGVTVVAVAREIHDRGRRTLAPWSELGAKFSPFDSRSASVPPNVPGLLLGRTDETGRCVFRTVPQWTYGVLIAHVDRESGASWSCHAAFPAASAAGQVLPVEIAVPRTTRIVGRVVDGDGQGVVARVTLDYGARRAPELGETWGMVTVYSGEDGSFELPGLVDGPNRVEVGAGGFTKWKRDDVPAGTTLEVVLERQSSADEENDGDDS